ARRGESSIQEDRENFRFREVSSKAKVIFDDSRPVVVPFQHGAAIIDSIQNRERLSGQPRFNRYDLRRLQRYMVNVRSQDFTRLREAGMVKPLLPNLDLYVLKEGCYHSHLGLIIDNHPLEDFIQ
ncbi:MAG: hypothetical protein ACUVQ6_00370, partial [Dissulfurimicrobium sp.]